MSTDHEIELSDERLLLRPFRLDDAEGICEAVLESMDELGRWLSWCHPNYSIADTREFLANACHNEGEIGLAIIERASGRIVGASGINQIDTASARANLGYWMRSGATGRGYATAATLLVARWAFETQGIERIEIVAAVGNHASQRVAEKAGATREGVARKRLRVHGVSHDAVVFSLVREDLLET